MGACRYDVDIVLALIEGLDKGMRSPPIAYHEHTITASLLRDKASLSKKRG